MNTHAKRLAILMGGLGALGISSTALAVPMELTHTGRLFDANGMPLDNTHDVTLSVYATAAGGTFLWRETVNLDFDNGFFTVDLGTDSSNPLDDTIFDGSDRWLGLGIDGNPDIGVLPIVSVPYAMRANTATHLKGGTVDADELLIDGQSIIDTNGNLAAVDGTLSGLTCGANEVPLYNGNIWGCTPVSTGTGAVAWTDLVSIPVDFLDGVDNDTLAALSCTDGDVALWNAINGAWECGNITVTEGDVETWITNAAIDLAAGSQVDGGFISTGPHYSDADAQFLIDSGSAVGWDDLHTVPSDFSDGIDNDLFATFSCSNDGEFMRWDNANSRWVCGNATPQTITQSGNTVTLSDGGGSISVADNDNDSSNELQSISLGGSNSDELVLDNGGGSVKIYQSISQSAGIVTLSDGGGSIDVDPDSTNEIQNLTLTGNELFISQGNSVLLPPDGDSSSNNEIQNLSTSSVGTQRTIGIDSGTGVTFDVADNDNDPTNEHQDLSSTQSGTDRTIAISNGASTTISVADNDNSTSNELQTLSASRSGVNQTISLTSGGSETFSVADNDNSATNELQDLTLSGGTLSLTGSGTSFAIDDDPTNELQSVTKSGSTVTMSGGGGSFSINDGDSSATNEIQTISASKSGNTVTVALTNGGSDTFSVADSDNGANNERQRLSWDAATGALTIDAGGHTSGNSATILGSGSITATHIATGAVGASEIATDAVRAAEIQAGAVGASEIATNAVGASEIATNAVGASEIAEGAVGVSEMAPFQKTFVTTMSAPSGQVNNYDTAGYTTPAGSSTVCWASANIRIYHDAADTGSYYTYPIYSTTQTGGAGFSVSTYTYNTLSTGTYTSSSTSGSALLSPSTTYYFGCRYSGPTSTTDDTAYCQVHVLCF